MDLLKGYSYPGNIRELENIIERAVALEGSPAILPQSLPPKLLAQDPSAVGGSVARMRPFGRAPKLGPDFNLEDELNSFEKTWILEALTEAGGVKTKAAELLGITFRSLRYRCNKQGIRIEE